MKPTHKPYLIITPKKPWSKDYWIFELLVMLAGRQYGMTVHSMN